MIAGLYFLQFNAHVLHVYFSYEMINATFILSRLEVGQNLIITI